MPDVNAESLIVDLIELALNQAIRYNALRRQAELEGRKLMMADVLRVQAELKANQVELDTLIAAMPPDNPLEG